ncbi:DUF3833 domain-containing protein [Rahnella sikkimica]|uniref:DUF3833 domain-containing protein n=1 Tax=Rahnella sikkimica TaxID=1805933 RepID=A0A2L1UQV0_9GAMM|nr:DUF3833 domain-containing protein [Rahnella sikkimica]AVF35277.1 hypothetical protein BV494_10160 [Rahnella sikkimica]
MTVLRKMLLPLLAACALLLTSCSASIKDYAQTHPTLDIFTYFAGDTVAYGMVQDYSHKQTRRFTAKIHGDVVADTLTLHEDFVYDDGEKQTRVWRIRKLADGTYTGTAGDIIGTATGQSAGNAFNWKYVMDVKSGGSTYRLTFDDWIYQQDEQHLFNVTSLRKFGVEVARVTLFFEKK